MTDNIEIGSSRKRKTNNTENSITSSKKLRSPSAPPKIPESRTMALEEEQVKNHFKLQSIVQARQVIKNVGIRTAKSAIGSARFQGSARGKPSKEYSKLKNSVAKITGSAKPINKAPAVALAVAPAVVPLPNKKSDKKLTHKENIKNVRFLVAGQYGITKSSAGREYKNDNSYYFTLYKYANRIKLFEVDRNKSPLIDASNYKKFALTYDQDSKELIKDIIKKSELPYVTSCATLFDAGEFFRERVNLQESLRTIYKMNYNSGININTKIRYNYPRHIVDFNPIHIRFTYNNKSKDYIISYNNSKIFEIRK